jgi:hypothetical protein
MWNKGVVANFKIFCQMFDEKWMSTDSGRIPEDGAYRDGPMTQLNASSDVNE